MFPETYGKILIQLTSDICTNYKRNLWPNPTLGDQIYPEIIFQNTKSLALI